jgi:pimeloyl-ACP methyl ester carboxylesterase
MPTIQANGETIHFTDEGKGPAVLFIHSLGTNGWLYADQIKALKGRYRCIAPDCRAHGGSSYNQPGFTVADMAADHKAVLDHLGVKEAHLVGLSMGGPIAFNFNTQFPGVAKSMVIADSFARPAAPDAVQDRIYATQEAVAYLSMLEFGNQYAGDRLMPTTPIDRLDELAAEIAKCPAKGYVDTCRAIFTYDAQDDLKKIKAPTLVLVGENDEATPMPASEFIRDNIKGATLMVVPGAGHLGTIDSPDDFTRLLGEFLDARG